MKGKIFRLIAIFLSANTIALHGYAQNAKEVSVPIGKMQQPAFQGDYKMQEKLMKETLEEQLAKVDLGKGKKYKGFRKYEGVVLPAVSDKKLDIYTKVDSKKSNTYVQILVSTGYDNFIGTKQDATIAANTITFLNKLSDDAVARQAAIDLKAQQEALKKAEEKQKAAAEHQAKAAKAQEEASKKAQGERLRLENLKGQNMNK